MLHKYVPQQFHDPFGLLNRLIRTGNRAAWFAVETALLGILSTPLDLALQIKEKRLYRRASKPKHPLIFVCGAPRTGTTLVTQVLINHLSVSYFNNLTAVFPRSPIIANQLFGKIIKSQNAPYIFFYGKSLHFSGPNDALYIWDRWLGTDRTRIRESLNNAEKSDMVQFFGAYQEAYQKPVINKNNNLNVQANVVAEVFDNAYFICMTLDPLYLAQSLWRARLEIHGDVSDSYGIHDPNRKSSQNFVEDVCRQVLFHEQKIREQQRRIGAERFWIVSYEQFCKEPELLIKRVSEQILGETIQMDELKKFLKPFSISNSIKGDPKVFEEIKQTLARLEQETELQHTAI